MKIVIAVIGVALTVFLYWRARKKSSFFERLPEDIEQFPDRSKMRAEAMETQGCEQVMYYIAAFCIMVITSILIFATP